MAAGFFFATRGATSSQGSEALFDYTCVKSDDRGALGSSLYLRLSKATVDFVFHGRLGVERRIVDRLVLRLPLEETTSGTGGLAVVVAEACTGWWPGPQIEVADRAPNLEILPPAGGYAALGWPCFDAPSPGGEHRVPRRRLVLDFLFELEHSTVFGEHRERIRRALRRSALVSALMDKVEYFWIRSRLEEETPSEQRVESASSSARDLQFSALNERATAWLLHCLDPSAPDRLRSSWFRPEVEDEVRCVVFWPGKRESRSWEKVIEMARLIENAGSSKAPRSGANGSEATAAEPQARIDLARRVHGLAAWFLRRYDMDAAFLWILVQASILPGRLGALSRSLTRRPTLIPVALGALPLAVILYAGLSGVRWSDQPAAKIATTLLLGGSAIAGVCRVLLRRMRCPSSSFITPLPAHPVSWSIGLVMTAFVAFYLLADLGGFNTPNGSLARRQAFGILLFLPLVPAAGLLALSLSRVGVIVALGVIRLALPRMFLAVAAAWTLMITTEEVVKANILVDWTRIVLVAVPLVTLASIFTTIEVNGQISSPRRAFTRAVRLVAVSFLISYGVGFFATNLIMPRYLKYSGFLMEQEFEAHAAQYGGRPPLKGETQEARNTSDKSPRQMIDDPTRERFLALERLEWGVPGAFLTGADKPGIRVMYAVEQPFPAVRGFPKALQLEWYFFPGVQLYTACFAMFAGLFFNLVFEGKLLTDPM